MPPQFLEEISERLTALKTEGLFKRERQMTSAQAGSVAVEGREAVNLCANNYLGLADHPALIKAATDAMRTHGYGMASVRFICGTQNLHRQLEKRLAAFLSQDDSLLFAACFDANGGLFEPLLERNDAIISDSLNHASIIDGIRLCKAQRYRYAHNDMADLEARLTEASDAGARHIMIATDGVFSMDGTLANLPAIRSLADKFGAVLMVDDCHATGFMGARGTGTPEHFGLSTDIVTGTLGKALGGAIGGYIAGPQPVIDLLRQRARPYLFSNALPPSVVAAGLAALEIVEARSELRDQLFANTTYWRAGLSDLGFDLLPGEHPIVPVMLGEARLAQEMAARLFDQGVLVSGFFFPVVPRGSARIRTQMNAALTTAQLDQALEAFGTVGRKLGVI
ncbi:MAG: glycine C-acetyltransferase [Pseudomonadota bacterium]